VSLRIRSRKVCFAPIKQVLRLHRNNNMFNPYIAGNPVGGDTAFIGRQDVLREVTRVLANPSTNAIVLYGQRRIGKTSILQQLAQQLPQAGAYLPVYFDLQDKAAWPLDKVLFVLAQTISHELELPQPEAVTEESFQQQFLPQVLAHLTQIKSSLVFLFDEFDVLDNPTDQAAGKAFFPYLTRLLNLAPKQLQFVFVIGRKPEDLTNLTLQVFKNIAAQRVSLLNEADTRQVILLSQENGTLQWTEEAINEIWQLTNGHPYLTQMLGQTIWDAAYLTDPDDAPTVTLDMVSAALPKTIESSTNALEWLWQGLASAERFVSSALAQAGQKAISQDELEKLLTDNGVRVLISQLQNAPQLLVDWDLLERVNGGYRFRVELLRRWIAEKKPISRVRAELDQIEPVANDFYQAGKKLYLGGQTDQATKALRDALNSNPNHVDAGLLLAQLLMVDTDGLDEAIKLLEQIYTYNPSAARYRLVQALLAKSEIVTSEDEQLELYQRIFVLDKHNTEAIQKFRTIWEKRGDKLLEQRKLNETFEAYQKASLLPDILLVKAENVLGENDQLEFYEHVLGLYPNQPIVLELVKDMWEKQGDKQFEQKNLDHALIAYQKANSSDKVMKVEEARRIITLNNLKTQAQNLEQEKKYSKALNCYMQLAQEYPQEGDWDNNINRLQKKLNLATYYSQAIQAFETNDFEKAKLGLIEVINLEAEYGQALELLVKIVREIDISDLQVKIEQEGDKSQKLSTKLDEKEKLQSQLRKYMLESMGIGVIVGAFIGGFFASNPPANATGTPIGTFFFFFIFCGSPFSFVFSSFTLVWWLIVTQRNKTN